MMAKNKICAIINMTEEANQLKPLTNHRPVSLLPFAGRYRIIDFLLSDIRYAGIESVALFIGRSGRSVYDHIRSGASWFLNSRIRGGIFTFSHQNWKRKYFNSGESDEDFYDNHRLFLERSHSGYVFITGGQIIANIDIRDIHQSHLRVERDITAVFQKTPKENINESDDTLPSIYFDEVDKIEKISRGAYSDYHSHRNVSLNMFLVSTQLMLEIIDRANQDRVYMELTDLILHYVNDYTLNPYEYTGYAKHIDSIQSYFQANMDMLDYSKYNSLFSTSIPILTKAKHGSPSYYSLESKVRNAFVGADSMIKGELKHSLANRRIIIENEARVHHSVLLQGTNVGRGAQVEYAIIDKNTMIDPKVRIIGSPDNIIVVAKNSHITESIGGS